MSLINMILVELWWRVCTLYRLPYIVSYLIRCMTTNMSMAYDSCRLRLPYWK